MASIGAHGLGLPSRVTPMRSGEWYTPSWMCASWELHPEYRCDKWINTWCLPPTAATVRRTWQGRTVYRGWWYITPSQCSRRLGLGHALLQHVLCLAACTFNPVCEPMHWIPQCTACMATHSAPHSMPCTSPAIAMPSPSAQCFVTVWLCTCSMTKLVKVDITAAEPQETVGCIQATENLIFGEAAFVPRDAAAHAAGSAAADDGFLITYASDVIAMTSTCMVRAGVGISCCLCFCFPALPDPGRKNGSCVPSGAGGVLGALLRPPLVPATECDSKRFLC